MSASNTIQSICHLQRQQRVAEQQLADEHKPAAIREAIVAALAEARGKLGDFDAYVDLETLCDLAPSVEGPEIVDELLAVLNHDEPMVRLAAGEALLETGYERFAELAHGVERQLSAGGDGPAMMETPLILAEIGEPGSLVLIRRFLAHDNADVVASSIESLYRLGDPEAIADIARFTNDGRIVQIDDFGQETRATLADLASECLEALQEAVEGR